MSAQTKTHVLIVGAGPGGLALGQALRKQGISFEIFERDALRGRTQGWALGIHSILSELVASVPSDLPPITVVDHILPLDLPAQMIYHDNSGASPPVGVQDTGDKSIIRANRERLHDWLATNMPIQHNKRAASITEDRAAGSVTAHFTDGTSATGTLLVGADGVNSVVRSYLLGQTGAPDKVTVLPIKSIMGEVTLSGADFEHELSLGYSARRVFRDAAADDDDGGCGPACQLFTGLAKVAPDGSSGDYYWAISSSSPGAALPSNGDDVTPEGLLATAHRQAAGLRPEFRRVMDLTRPEGIVWPPLTFRCLELDPADLPVGRVTLLGDAAHCMPPFRGEGAVNAMMDALRLAGKIGQIAESNDDEATVEKVMGDYQAEMLDRGVKAVQASRAALSSNNESRITWGRPVTELPDQKVRLADIRILA